jgi:MoaA/NifB/PqqE/SkfB family radical SAM enzyme
MQWIDRNAIDVYSKEMVNRIGHYNGWMRIIEGFSKDLGVLQTEEIKKLISEIKDIKLKSGVLLSPKIYFFPDFDFDDEIVHWFSPGVYKIDMCNNVFKKFRIYMNGDIYPVCGIPFYYLGNIEDNSLVNIVKGERMRNLYEEMQQRGYFYLCQRCCRRAPESHTLIL